MLLLSYHVLETILVFSFVLQHIYCISNYFFRILTEISIIFNWKFCLHFGRIERFQIIFIEKFFPFFEISMNICWNSFQIGIHWKLIYYLLKFQQIFIESLELGWKNGWKVNKISLKNIFTDHSLKVQWLFVDIFSLTFKWYKTFTPRHQLYIT